MALPYEVNEMSRMQLQDLLDDIPRRIYDYMVMKIMEPNVYKESLEYIGKDLESLETRLEEVKEKYRTFNEDPEKYIAQVIKNHHRANTYRKNNKSTDSVAFDEKGLNELENRLKNGEKLASVLLSCFVPAKENRGFER